MFYIMSAVSEHVSALAHSSAENLTTNIVESDVHSGLHDPDKSEKSTFDEQLTHIDELVIIRKASLFESNDPFTKALKTFLKELKHNCHDVEIKIFHRRKRMVYLACCTLIVQLTPQPSGKYLPVINMELEAAGDSEKRALRKLSQQFLIHIFIGVQYQPSKNDIAENPYIEESLTNLRDIVHAAENHDVHLCLPNVPRVAKRKRSSSRSGSHERSRSSTPEPPLLERVIQLRGLPFRVAEREVKEFVSPHRILSLIWLTDPLKPRDLHRGSAFLEFADPEEAHEVIRKFHKKHMESRYIEVFEATRGELRKAVRNEHQRKHKGILQSATACIFYKKGDPTSCFRGSFCTHVHSDD